MTGSDPEILRAERWQAQWRQEAFTLIELLAVVAIFGLMAALIVPNMGLLQSRALRGEAEQIASRLELARQRTIVTGKPHRLTIDLEESNYILEWLAADELAEDGGGATQPENAGATPGASTLSLAPDRAASAFFRPLPGLYGKRKWLEDGIFFARVETDQGDADRGETTIEFENDGTTDGATIVLENENGDAFLVEVAPLADAVRVMHAES
jgi:prepilin-type N-terminal cleavage/methylation domain-containing protein